MNNNQLTEIPKKIGNLPILNQLQVFIYIYQHLKIYHLFILILFFNNIFMDIIYYYIEI